MKRIAKIMISIILTIVLTSSGMLALAHIVERKSSDFKYKPFFDEKQNFDVLFMGTSHVINGVFPMELWKDYGIVSYNFGGHGNEIATTYWVLKNALEYTTPQLVVLDCLKLGTDAKVCDNKNYLHYSFDAFPLTPTKIEAMNDLLPEGDRSEMLCEFSVYHSRWNEITSNDIETNYTKEKGAEARIGVAVPKQPIWIGDELKTEPNTLGVLYTKKIIELCQEKGIKVLLTYLPFPPAQYHQKDANLASDIARQYGVNYINFLKMKDIINVDTDCYDPDSHLNASGAQKVTNYLGKYIQDTYQIPDRRNDSNYSKWHQDYIEYTSAKLHHIQQETSLDNVLMLLSDKKMNSCLFIKGDSKVLQDKRMITLIRNILPNKELSKLQNAIEHATNYLLVVDQGKSKIIEIASNEEELEVSTSFGTLHYINGAKPSLCISQDEKCQEYLINEETQVVPEVEVIVSDNESQKVRYSGSFSSVSTDKNGHLIATKQSINK